MSYKKCSRKIMTEVMDEFKENKLKSRNEEIIKNKKQALAIGLSTVEKKFSSVIPIYSKNSLKYFIGNSLSYFFTKLIPSSLVIFSFLISCAASYEALPNPNFMNVR